MRSLVVGGWMIVALGAIVFAARQTTQSTPDPLVREGATVKITPHVYVIPDDNVPLVPNVGIIVGSRATLKSWSSALLRRSDRIASSGSVVQEKV